MLSISTFVTLPRCSENCASCARDAEFHTRTQPSGPPLTMKLGDHAIVQTPPRCARPELRHCSSPASWNRMIPSLQPEMTPCPTYSQHSACASLGSLAAGGASYTTE